jgi:hypothetical protein
MFWRRITTSEAPEEERMRSDLDLMDLQAKTLFVHDQSGRMRTINAPRGKPAPAFFLGCTALGNVWRFRFDVSTTLARRLDALANSEPPLADPQAPPVTLEAIRRTFAEFGERPQEHTGPVYRFPERLKRPKGFVEIAEGNEQLLRFGFADLIPTLRMRQPMVAVVQDGVAISVCYSGRLTKYGAQAAVLTLNRYREQGYGTLVTLGWAIEARVRGLIPMFSCSWENAASLSIARKLELIQFGTDLYYFT